jgi:hypothetical protein
MGTSVAQFDLSAHSREKFAGGLNVANLRNVLENYGFVGEQRRRHARQCSVLRSADANRPEQGIAAADD